MSRKLQITLWVLVFAFSVAIAGNLASHSFQKQPRLHTYNNAGNKNAQQKVADRAIPKESEKAITLYNYWLMIFTGVLAIVALVQILFVFKADKTARIAANAARKAAETADTNLIATQRPFVFIRLFETRLIRQDFQIQPQWENSGNTPAMRMRSYANWKVFASEPPPGYTWPDLDSQGNELSEPGPGETRFIGPKATQYAEILKVPITTMENIRQGSVKLFVWGWAEYGDIISDTARHRTEFCNEFLVTDLSGDNTETRTIAAVFRIHGHYNTAT